MPALDGGPWEAGVCGPYCNGCDIPYWGPDWGLLEGIVWTRLEYLLWWMKGSPTPPLVTTSPAGTPRDVAGVLGQSTTQVVFGDDWLNEGVRSGLRTSLGVWLDRCHTSGVEATFLGIGRESTSFYADQLTNPILARPFYDVNPAAYRQDPNFTGPTASLVAYPGYVQGSVTASLSNEFHTVDVLFRQLLSQECSYRIDGLVGYRFARLEEDLRINEFKTALTQQGTVPANTTIAITDRFLALNEFHGGELGLHAHLRRCRWSVDGLLKLALGTTASHVAIGGSTVFTLQGQAPMPAQSGGLLALPTNSGVHRHADFAVMPELGVTIGYDLTCRLRATFGYTFLYISRVARPGDQIGLDLNSSQFPAVTGQGQLVGLSRPEFRLINSDFWAQGLNFGLDYRF